MIAVTWEQKDGISIATLDGRIDGSNADETQSMLESGIDSEDRALILDFEKVSYISSAGAASRSDNGPEIQQPG